jgi:hypothetical protein
VAIAVYIVTRGVNKSREQSAGVALSNAKNATALQEVIINHANTNAAASAKLLLADMQAGEGKTGDAIKTLQDFIATNTDHPAKPTASAKLAAKLMSENKMEELNVLYKKSAINLQVFGGLILVGIFLNINQMYLVIPDDYSGGLMAVFLIGLAKFYDVILGNNNAILLNTKYYRMVLLFGVILVVLMIGLNMLLIPLYGITGSALATLLSVIFYNTIKLLFIVKKMNLYPFGPTTIQSFAIIAIILVAFYFWEFPFEPWINIVIKSILITISYVYLNYKFKISMDINDLIDNNLNRYFTSKKL